MRLSEDLPLDPEVLAELDAIDATLRGEAVDPRHAELAELALLLADQREMMPARAASSLDAAVARRFAPVPAPAAEPARLAEVGGPGAPTPPSQRPRLTRWALRPSFGAALAGLAAVAVAGVIVVNNNSGVQNPANLALQPGPRAPQAASATHSAASGARSAPAIGAPSASGSGSFGSGASDSAHTLAGSQPAATAPQQRLSSKAHTPPATTTSPSAVSSSSAASGVAQPAPAALPPTGVNGAATGSFGAIVPTPPGNGRKLTQAAQLQLSSSGNRIGTVSQELFNVVGLYHGIVKTSQITAAGQNGYAYFGLSIPSSSLQQALSALSTLHYAHVVSRTDATQDVNGQYNGLVRKLGDDRALRTSLLKQLATATTQAQIISLQAQIKDAEAAIARDEAALAALNHKINYSAVDVQINAAPIVPLTPAGGSSHGFTLGTAWHDAIHVLTVAAGVSLIALAILIPLGLVAALIAWIAYWVRRRRREAALDAA
jgi:hypothetical protein